MRRNYKSDAEKLTLTDRAIVIYFGDKMTAVTLQSRPKAGTGS